MNKIKKEYIKQAIDKWDPIDLLPFAPPDEYDPETKKIYNIIKDLDNIDVNYLGKIIFDIFVNSFVNDIFLKTLDECNIVANDIFQLVE